MGGLVRFVGAISQHRQRKAEERQNIAAAEQNDRRGSTWGAPLAPSGFAVGQGLCGPDDPTLGGNVRCRVTVQCPIRATPNSCPRLTLMDRGADLAQSTDEGAQVTSGFSRRGLFAALPGGLGLSGCSASQLIARQGPSNLALRISPRGSVNLDSTAQQAIDIRHASGVRPTTAQVILVDVIQDDPTVDTSGLRWAPGYPIYDEAASTDTEVRVLVKFAAPAGVPATGRARILFEM